MASIINQKLEELTIAKKQIAFQNQDKKKKAAELIIANKELFFQNEEKEKRAAELILTNEEIKKAEGQLKKQTKELTKSNAELEQFAYVASHDLQEPLRMIISFLTLIEKKYGNVLDDKGKKYIFYAVDGAKRMRQIILDLLEYSRVGTTEDKHEKVELNDLVKEILLLLRKQIKEKRATIQIENLPVINAYKIPILRIFQNLIGNALKYTREGVAPKINITVKELIDHWQFSVSDNGIGIREEYFNKISIIFQRLHNNDEYSGTGMGLAITKKIIDNLGGKIWVESVAGKGSTFYFTVQKKPTYLKNKFAVAEGHLPE